MPDDEDVVAVAAPGGEGLQAAAIGVFEAVIQVVVCDQSQRSYRPHGIRFEFHRFDGGAVSHPALVNAIAQVLRRLDVLLQVEGVLQAEELPAGLSSAPRMVVQVLRAPVLYPDRFQ